MSPEEDGPRGLSRERLVGAALQLINEDGLDALSMRALADRLDVKAASLYWHVRDRRGLLGVLAEADVATGPPGRGRGGGGPGRAAAGPGLSDRGGAQKARRRDPLWGGAA